MLKTNTRFVEKLFEDYHNDLHRYLASRLRGGALDAADVAQETYLRLLRMNNTEAVQHPHAYLFRVAANVIRELGLKEQVQDELPVRLTDPTILHSSSPAPEDELQIQKQIEHLRKAINRLPPKCRAVLIMKKRDGLSRKEIAEKLGISELTVKTHLMKAVAWCREHGTVDKESRR